MMELGIIDKTGEIPTHQNIVAVKNEKQLNLTSGRKAILPPINFNADDELLEDYLPKNLLVTLTQACTKFDDLGPNSKRMGKFAQRRVDNVWHHEKSRRKLKHLSEQPPCHCGAGSDISYLLDATAEKQKTLHFKGQKSPNKDEAPETLEKNLIPETIIPSEFHVVKHKGAVGLEIYDEMYTTKTESHEEHLTVFPSLKPSGRQEALQLMQTMNKLLKKAGIPDESEKAKLLSDVTDGSQIENLLKLVKEEQTIYNIIFNEVIRQVSIECNERGSVLAELRKRYVKLLEGIPKQVKSLHEEVLAQRALDRRLTEELSNFKTSITLLTKELHEIHAHDEEVTKQAIETQAELNEALKESEKNASLLAEYHDLYELQRRRLDYQLRKLIEERDLWAGCAHMLSIKVTEKHNLVTIRRLHLHEKAWYKLAHNFAVLLGQEDEKQLQVLAGHIHKWQEIADSFHEKLYNAEIESCNRMKEIESSIGSWAKKFERVVTPDEGSVHPPQTGDIQSLLNDMKSWEATFNRECERFMGDVLLSCEDDLLQLNKCVDMWVDTASNIFCNHPTRDKSNHPQQDLMIELNGKVEKLHNDFKLRMSGENGITKILMRLLHNLDTWIHKMNSIIHGGETLFDAEWLLLADLFQVQWKESLNSLIRILSSGVNDGSEVLNDRNEIVDEWLLNKSDVYDVYDATQKWLCAITSAVENEDSNIVEQVVTTHSNMVRWTITMLIRIAPNVEDKDCPEGLIEEDSNAGLGAAILAESTSELIISRATLLFNWLRSLTDLIVSCLKGIVENTSKNQMECNKTEEEINQKDLIKIENECCGWMNTANLLIDEVTGSTIPMKDFLPLYNNSYRLSPCTTFISSTSDAPSEKESYGLSDGKSISETASSFVTSDDGEKNSIDEEEKKNGMHESSAKSEEQIDMHIIGYDENVKKRRMESICEDTLDKAASLSRKDISNLSVEELRTMELLQEQLIATEIRAQNAEEKAFSAESALKDAEERIRALERTLSKVKEKKQDSAPASKVSSPSPKTEGVSTSSESPLFSAAPEIKTDDADSSAAILSPETDDDEHVQAEKLDSSVASKPTEDHLESSVGQEERSIVTAENNDQLPPSSENSNSEND